MSSQKAATPAWASSVSARACSAMSLGVSLAIATLPFLTLMSARQYASPAHPVTAGAALGATAGAWSGVLVSLWCPVPHPLHVLVGHVLPVVLLSALGGALGRRVVGFREAGRRR